MASSSTSSTLEQTQSMPQNLESASSPQLPAADLLSKTVRCGNKINGFPPRSSHAAVAVGSSLYSFGGSGNFDDPSYSYDVLDVFVLNSNEQGKEWKKLPVENSEVNPNQRYGHSAVAHKEFVLIFGGWDAKRGTLSNSTYLFNTQTRKWNKPKVFGNVPGARGYHTAVVFRNEMLIYNGSGFNMTADLHSLHLESFHWSTIETKGIPSSVRSGHSATVHSDRFILIFGGIDSKENKEVNTLHSFDINSKTWTAVETRGTLPSSREHHCAFMHSGRMYIFGGANCPVYFNDVFIYDPDTFEWKEVAPNGKAPSPRWAAACVALDDQAIIFGGSNSKDYLRDTHVLHL